MILCSDFIEACVLQFRSSAEGELTEGKHAAIIESIRERNAACFSPTFEALEHEKM